jgi:hypothetical protein
LHSHTAGAAQFFAGGNRRQPDRRTDDGGQHQRPAERCANAKLALGEMSDFGR